MDEFSDLDLDLSKSIEEVISPINRLTAINKFAPKYEVKLLKSKKYKGYYRVGKMPNFEEQVEKYGLLSQQFQKDMGSDESGIIGLIFLAILSPFIVLALFVGTLLIPLILIMIPFSIASFFFTRFAYMSGMFPAARLTCVDHVYVHPEGSVVVPMGKRLSPFTFEVEGNMRLVTHFHDGIWESISIVRGRRQFFKLKKSFAGGAQLNVQAVKDFLEGFGLEHEYQRTTTPEGGGGGGGGD